MILFQHFQQSCCSAHHVECRTWKCCISRNKAFKLSKCCRCTSFSTIVQSIVKIMISLQGSDFVLSTYYRVTKKYCGMTESVAGVAECTFMGLPNTVLHLSRKGKLIPQNNLLGKNLSSLRVTIRDKSLDQMQMTLYSLAWTEELNFE